MTCFAEFETYFVKNDIGYLILSNITVCFPVTEC